MILNVDGSALINPRRIIVVKLVSTAAIFPMLRLNSID
jgi:hypothetical protein